MGLSLHDFPLRRGYSTSGPSHVRRVVSGRMTVAPETPLDVLFTPRPLSANEYEFTLPDGWQQGRGLFGGLVAGVLIRALETAVGPERALRSLTCEMCGPTLPGLLVVRVELLRAGHAVTTMAARLLQNGEVQAHAVGVFGKPRADARVVVELPAPNMPDWRSIEAVDLGPSFAPDFLRYFELRPISGVPFSGATSPTTSVFVRHATPAEPATMHGLRPVPTPPGPRSSPLKRPFGLARPSPSRFNRCCRQTSSTRRLRCFTGRLTSRFAAATRSNFVSFGPPTAGWSRSTSRPSP